jgi:hypothetical protein
MSKREQQEAAVNTLRMIPTKWAIAIVVALIAYVLLQPRLNQWFGWKLPSLAGLVGDEKPAAKKQPERTTDTKPSRETKESAEEEDTSPDTGTARASEHDSQGVQSYGYLKELGRSRYESPEGLVYGRGSEEGHRLKHIARHLEDQPNRPGSHGVFEGTMQEFLQAIDDTYARAKRKAKGTKSRSEDSETVYEAPFEKAIGYLGGEDGKRKKNPPLKRLRIVVRDKSLVTAFPIQ